MSGHALGDALEEIPTTAPRGRAPSEEGASRGPRRFLALPADEVAFLRGTLSLHLAEPRVGEILRMFGRRLGRSIATLDPDAPEVGASICHIGAQVGLGTFTCDEEGGDEGGSGAGAWALTLDRLAETGGRGPQANRPEFTAGFIEGLFEGVLGTRVRGELTRLGGGRWRLRVALLATRGREVRGTGRTQLPPTRAFRMEVADSEEFFTRLAPFILPGATLGLTRESPRRLRTEFGYDGVELCWIAVTRRGGESTISPQKPGRFLEVAEGFLGSHPPPSLLFVQGLDSLAARHDPQTVLRLLQILQERALSHGSSLVLEVPVASLDPGLLASLRREFHLEFPSEAD